MTINDAAGSAAFDAGAVRVGDSERNSAVAALGEHLSTGRLDIEEYGNRSAAASAARTVAELTVLFADLPAPHPRLPDGSNPSESAGSSPSALAVTGSRPIYQPSAGGLPVSADSRTRAQRLVAAAAACSGVLALVLFFVTNSWLWFLLIPLISSVASAYWGDSWRATDRRRDRR